MSEQQEPASETQEPKSYTQEDVDRIVANRLKRERDKTGDVEDLRKKAAKLDELEAANRSEVEKLTSQLTEATQRAESAEAKAKSTLTRSAITAAAVKANFIDPTDAHRFIDADEIEFDGEEPKNIDALLKALAKAKPHLVTAATGGNGSGDGGPRGSSFTEETPGQAFGRLVSEKLGR